MNAEDILKQLRTELPECTVLMKYDAKQHSCDFIVSYVNGDFWYENTLGLNPYSIEDGALQDDHINNFIYCFRRVIFHN